MAPEPKLSTGLKASSENDVPEASPEDTDKADMTSPPEDEQGEEDAEREFLLDNNTRNEERDPEVVSYTEPEPPLPPDGGYGWVIAFSSFMINLIVDGMCYMGGVLYIELLDYFQQSKGKTQWIHTLVPAIYLATGPFVGALVNKYGCRKITIIGSLVAAASFVISSMAPCVEMLIVTYGIMVGIGFGMMYLPAVCFVSYYFDRKRALATGIAVCGSGIGTFIFPPLMNIILNAYGWRGGLLLLAAITLNCAVFGALLRPLRASKPKPKKLKDQKKTRKEKAKEKKMAKEMERQRSIIMQKIIEQKNRQRTTSTGSLDGTVITTDNTLVKDPALLKMILQTETVTKLNRSPSINNSAPDLTNLKHHKKDHSDKNASHKRSTEDFSFTKSQPSSPTLSKKISLHEASQKSHTDQPQLASPHVVNKHLLKVKEIGGSANQLRMRQTSESSGKSVPNGIGGSTTSLVSLEQKRKDMSRIMYRQDIFYTGSVTSIAEYKSNPDMARYVQSVVSVPGSEAAVSSNKCAPFTNIIFQMFDLRLFKSITFVLLMGNAFFSFLGFFVPFMFVPDLAKIQGATVNYAALLISILGVCNTIGRVAAGWLADRPWADCLVIQNASLITGGIATLFVPLYVNYTLLAIYCAVFGTCMAMFIALRSIVTAEMLGIQKLNNAFGLTIFFQGIAGVAGSPLAGTIYDATGSYAVSFIIAGSFITFSGLICLPLRRIARWENDKPSGDQLDLDEVEGQMTLDDLPFPDADESTNKVKFVENQNV